MLRAYDFRKAALSLLLLGLLDASAVLAQAVPQQARAHFRVRLEDSPKAIVDEVWQTVNREYVDNSFNQNDWLLARKQLLEREYASKEEAYKAIRATLKELGDPYTRFLDPREFQALKDQTSGELVGVGLTLGASPTNKLPVIMSTLKGSPATKAGVQAKDQLVAVDDKPTTGVPLDKVSSLIRGDSGTKVTLTVLRGDKQKLSFTITRAPIELPAVQAVLKEEDGKKLGYIQLQEFSEKATPEMKRAFKELTEQGAQGWVLDLRGNPGGLLDAATAIANLLLDQGTIVSTVNRQGVQEKLVSDRAPQTTLPTVVLVDGGSASASEILAGALKDNNRATLVGTKTFGKGVIQQVNALTDGSGVNVTIAHYLTPAGNDIHKKGITPDVVVPITEEVRKKFTADKLGTSADPQYQRAATILAAKLGNPSP